MYPAWEGRIFQVSAAASLSPAVAHGEAGFLVIWPYLVVLINRRGYWADRLVSELWLDLVCVCEGENVPDFTHSFKQVKVALDSIQT